jgi:rhodanese-related sulfurtransferase
VGELLEEARARIGPRRSPAEAEEAARQGALIVDLRSRDERERHGVIPGSLHVPRAVLEWRADPDSGWTSPHLGDFDRELILVCAQGYSSSFAAATLRELGYRRATDLIGGFEGWRDAGLPVLRGPSRQELEASLPGMGDLEPPSF